ncbi:MAG: cation:proton antiporter [Rhizobiales bacterium]|nr:cation:proton antiporter [Hyphomicrobiales bacterium]
MTEDYSVPLTGLNDIAVVALIAVLLGFVFMRLRQPPIVGYILAGLILGPTGLGVIHQSHAVELLAEMGVLLLLFLIGMEISIRAFVLVLKPAVLVAAGQISIALVLTTGFGVALGWSDERILLLGFVIAVSSTAVTLKVLEEIDALRSETGRIAIGVMIAQDIAIVPMLILAEAFGTEAGINPDTIALVLIAVALLALLIWYLGKPGKIRLPFTELIENKPDVIALAALAFCFAAAAVSGWFGMSPAYGAFVAGLIIANTTLRSQAIQVTQPVLSILIFVFFLSIGLLIDLNFILDNMILVISFAFGVVFLKTIINIALIRLAGIDWNVALLAGLSMAQIGEFSFILAAVGLRNGILDIDAYRLALSVIALSIVISPLWMSAARRIHDAALEGISDYRQTLTETYSDELALLQESTASIGRFGQALRIHGQAARKALTRRREEPGNDT